MPTYAPFDSALAPISEAELLDALDALDFTHHLSPDTSHDWDQGGYATPECSDDWFAEQFCT